MGRKNLNPKSNAFKRQEAFFMGNKSQERLEAIGQEHRLLMRDNPCEPYSPVEVNDYFGRSVVAADTSPSSTSFSHYNKYIDDLSLNRVSNRKKALEKLVMAYETDVLTEFTKNKYITLSYWSSKLIKKGTTAESHLACRLIGLLAVNIDCEDASHEMMKETITPLCEAYKSGSKIVKILVLQCIAMICSFGAMDPDELQDSMKFSWEIFYPKPTDQLGETHPAVLSAALSAWTFLLTFVDEWRIHPTNWKGLISFLYTLMEKEDQSLYVSIAEVLALILDMDRLYKFSEENSCTSIDSLKSQLSEKFKKLPKEPNNGSNTNDKNSEEEFLQGILLYIENGASEEVYTKISKKYQIPRVSTWKQILQLRYVEKLLGRNFSKHMKRNYRLLDAMRIEQPIIERPLPQPTVFGEFDLDQKARTQLRKMSAQRKQSLLFQGHFDIED
ncbi:uncharacterized protein LOC122040302 [Zingiber officinale]|uniref:uncharacterized protein LOC122040302 n=1 Tax=Zingiber officinale TaxID=94328 RepID=UPI001C4C5079|nr:uncharacterized protein LOC122040302 [Zingiber officinale]